MGRLGIMLVVGLTALLSTDSSTVLLPFRASVQTQQVVLTAQDESTQQILEDFQFCRQPWVGDASHETGLLDVWYQCEGAVYDDFGQNLELFANTKTELGHKPASWGHRSSVLLPKSTVLVFGNSHARQIGQAMACQNGQVERIDRQDPDALDPNMAVLVSFTNGAKLWIVANSYVAHSPHWQRLLEAQVGLKLSQFDAVVLGVFNTGENKRAKEHQSTFVTLMIQMQARRPSADEINVQLHSGPTVADMVAVYDGPLMFASMFSTQRVDRALAGRQQIQQEQTLHNRTNLLYEDTRQYIVELSQEGGGYNRSYVSPCVNDASACHMHRCTGKQGGHPDLISWDVSEFLFTHVG